MNKEPKFSIWQGLSLLFAFIAGAAVFGHLAPLLSEAPATQLTSVSASNTRSTVESPDENAANQAIDDETATDDSLETISLFWQNEIDDLREELSIARDQIDALSDDVEGLTVALNLSNLDQAQASNRSGDTANVFDEAAFGFGGRRGGALTSADDEKEALRQTGLNQERIDAIQRQQDQQALARLELLDRAEREGWSNSERLGEELDTLEETSSNLREELGDELYDQYLYNLGRPNRVIVASIIAGSTADISGMQPGDVIMSYASSRVFSLRELRDATREGVRNEPILVDVMRDQQAIRLDAIRGPLGITMTAASVAP